MKDQIEQRLSELQAEFEAGQKMLAELEKRQAELRQTMLRISGAIQVLEEMLEAESRPSGNGAAPTHEPMPVEEERAAAKA